MRLKESMLIKGRTTVRNNGWEYNIDVKFYDTSQKMEIVIPFSEKRALEVGEFLFAKTFSPIVIVDEKGEEYTAYDCRCIKKTVNVNTVIIGGNYRTLIKGRKLPNEGRLSFYFDGMENYFGNIPKCEIDNSMPENQWGLVKNDETVKFITHLKNVGSLEMLISLLIKVRGYFEFLTGHEIAVNNIVFSDRYESIQILNDRFLMTERDCWFNEACLEKPEALVRGVNQWILHYETYEEVLGIWKKTIYNKYVSDEDVFIWRCQALELLCTLYSPLFQEAEKQKNNPSQQNPNLANFLEALNNKCAFISDKNVDFSVVKNVRNVYTHYNPQKHITEREWRNASFLIERALKVSIAYVMDLEIKGFPFGIWIPKGTMEHIRR